jgi:hypothetical protein
VIRKLLKNGFTGPILVSIAALSRLAYLCAPPPPPCGLSAASGVRTGMLVWRRHLDDNRFSIGNSGSVPSTISALTALTYMCAPTPGRIRRMLYGACVAVRARDAA